MKSNFYPAIFERNIGAVTIEEQKKIRETTVCIVGLGGIGGIAFELLVRSGIEHFVLVDKDKYEISNLNRQILSSLNCIGKNKVDVAESFALSINPNVKIEKFAQELNEKNCKKILEGKGRKRRKRKKVDIVVDGLDNALSRIVLSRTAKRIGIPYVFGAAEKDKGISSIFLPRGKSYEETFMLPSSNKKISKIKQSMLSFQRCESILGVVSNIIGCFEALQTINYILGRPTINAPYFLHINANASNKMLLRIGKL